MKRSRIVVSVFCSLITCFTCQAGLGQELTREEKVRADRKRVEAEGLWLYNDLDGAYAQARATGKPILVVLRCLPCEECVKLDDQLVDNDPVIKPLLQQFVCVRVVGTNGLDLDTFQYDTDQSFAVFMLNADKTIYGRFGTRSHRTEWIGDVSLDGMARALEGALALHADYPNNADSLAGKRGQPLEFSSPEQFPGLKEKYTDQLDYAGDVVKSCIHCHQIGEARREFYWHNNQPIPQKLLFSYPHPKSIGLILDPKQRASVKSIVEGSLADEAGLQAGDELTELDGQPLLSIADVQWVLHNTPAEGAELAIDVDRQGESLQLKLGLPEGWRQADDLSWRVSSWTMGRMTTGGMRLEPLTEVERSKAGIAAGKMALRARHVGQYNAHATAKRAGLEKGDVILEYDGRDTFANEAEIFAYVNQLKRPGDRIELKYLRGGRQFTTSFAIQK